MTACTIVWEGLLLKYTMDVAGMFSKQLANKSRFTDRPHAPLVSSTLWLAGVGWSRRMERRAGGEVLSSADRLMPQRHARVSQGRIYMVLQHRDCGCRLNLLSALSQYTDVGATSCSTDPIALQWGGEAVSGIQSRCEGEKENKWPGTQSSMTIAIGTLTWSQGIAASLITERSW